ncbi:hypothetical protein MBANPS3_012429, partial [Mucor bainieri]
VRDLITLVDEETTTGNRKRHTWSISNAHYQVRTGVHWHNQTELHARGKTGVQAEYDQLEYAKTNTREQFEGYARSVYKTHNALFGFNKAYRHRERKGYMHSNRQRTLAHIGYTVAGINPKAPMPFRLTHRSDSRTQKTERRRARQEENHVKPTKRTVVFFGDASVNSTMKGYAALPQKTVQKAIARKSLVVRTDEYLTSQKCSTCEKSLQDLTTDEPVLLCDHRQAIKRSCLIA